MAIEKAPNMVISVGGKCLHGLQEEDRAEFKAAVSDASAGVLGSAMLSDRS